MVSNKNSGFTLASCTFHA